MTANSQSSAIFLWAKAAVTKGASPRIYSGYGHSWNSCKQGEILSLREFFDIPFIEVLRRSSGRLVDFTVGDGARLLIIQTTILSRRLLRKSVPNSLMLGLLDVRPKYC